MNILFTDNYFPLKNQPEDVIQVCRGANKWYYYVWTGRRHTQISASGAFENMYDEIESIKNKIKEGMKYQHGKIN
tara:strand:+ start:802 stop:1026 length:225 start_codon:yes stop_codon:yes gene_type:complete